MLGSLPGAGPSVLGACALWNVLEAASARLSVFWRVIEASWNALEALQEADEYTFYAAFRRFGTGLRRNHD